MSVTTTSGSNPGNPPERERTGEAAFSVSARVALQLGRESISSSVTAILELVKNAYDADADHVRIRFSGLDGPRAILAIEDDGTGMTEAELKKSWLVIGTTSKVKKPKSKKGRVKTGEKGLGRLGLDRLSTKTRVQTKVEGSRTATELEVDWSLYEGTEHSLESIKHQLYSLPDLDYDPLIHAPTNFPKGTRLILEGLKEQWTPSALLALRKELGLLLSPFGGAKDFAISIDSGLSLDDVDGPVKIPKYVLDVATWKVSARISELGVVSILMSSKLHDESFRLGPIPWDEFAKGGADVPACGPVKFDLYYFPRIPVSLDDQTLGRRDLDTFLDSNQGIRIYRDRFRVKPYGNPDGSGDWLKLSFRKSMSPAAVSRTGNWRVAYNQVIGAVFIDRENNPALSDQTNREGLLEGEGYRDLIVFAKNVINFFEHRHSEFYLKSKDESADAADAKQLAEERAEASLTAMERLIKVFESIPVPTGKDESIPLLELRRTMGETMQALVSSQEAARDSEKQAEARLEQVVQEKNTMANLASLGILNVAFGHETLGHTDTAAKYALWLQESIVDNAILLAPDVREEAIQSLEELADCTRKVETFARFALVTIGPAKRRRKRFSLNALILDVFETFRSTLEEERHITIDLRLPSTDDLHIRAYPSDWDSILVNLITNAVWAMTDTPSERRCIRVTLASDAKEAVLTFEDSGRGLEAGTEKQIFMPTFSTRRDEKGESIGTGMGLAILKSCVVENSGGAVSARAIGDLGGAAFEIRVSKVKMD